MMFDKGNRFKKNEEIILEKDIDDKKLIFNIHNTCAYEVSGVSKYIWDNIGILSYQEIVSNIANKYEISKETVCGDLNEFIEQLLESELILIKGDV